MARPFSHFSRAAFFGLCLGAALLFSPGARRAEAQQPESTPAYVVDLTPRDRMTVQMQPARTVSATLPQSPASDGDTKFVNSLLELLQDAMITKLQARVTLEKVALEKGRVRLSGVLLRDAKIGLRLKNNGAQKLADTLLNRYGGKPNAPSWLRVLHLAKYGIYNDLEFSLTLEELRLRELAIDADSLQVEGFGVHADAGPSKDEDEDEEEAPVSNDALRAILRVLQKSAISRAEAHLNLDHLAARRLRLGLDGFALKNLHILVALRRADANADTSQAAP